MTRVEESMTVYCPGSEWHYQIQVLRVAPAASVAQQRRTFRLQKDADPKGLWWRFSLCAGGTASTGSGAATGSGVGARTAQLEVNAKLMGDQHARMRAGKVHSFSVIVCSLLRNALSLVQVLGSVSAGGSRAAGATAAAERSCYYPGLFEPSEEVRTHYEQKALANKAVSAPPAPDLTSSEVIRSYNNLIKVLLIEQQIDTLPGPVNVLDLGCGRGQDVLKYSRECRPVDIAHYVGVDFAKSAVDEAMSRHQSLVRRGKARDPPAEEYAAHFFAGDVRNAATFQQIREAGHTSFDVVSAQFVLNYLAASRPMMHALFAEIRSLLRPGGRVIGSIPSCEVLADLCAVGGSTESELFRVVFSDDAAARPEEDADAVYTRFARDWGIAYSFTLAGAVEAQTEFVVPWESFEELVTSLGFRVVLEANFPNLLEQYGPTSPFFNDVFSKSSARGGVEKLKPEEKELFELYSSFVLRRMEDV